MSYREVIDLVQPSIVRLATGGGSGSGFIIQAMDNWAYVATNQHVVEDASGTITARVGDRAIYSSLVVGEDDLYDFAIVWICCSDDFRALPLAEAGAYSSGDEIGAFGYPLGASEMEATWGEIDFINSEPNQRGWDLESDLNTTSGNSGGPLLNRDGYVVGIHAGSVRNQPFASGVSAKAIQERMPLLIADHTPDSRDLPTIDWRSGVSVSGNGILELDITISSSAFSPCDGNTPKGHVCNPNVVVYRDGFPFQAVYGYYCGEGSKGRSVWCIDEGDEKHFYYPSSGRLTVEAFTNLYGPTDGTRWDVCIHDNKPDHPILGCSPIQWGN